MRPTRLYIKQHSVTGLKYLGKSVKEDIEKYKGGGKRWNYHIRKHGRDHVKTIWVSDWFYQEEEIKEYALNLSHKLDVVESEEFANLKPENGLDGGTMPDHILKQSAEKRKGRTKDTHEYLRIAGEKRKQYTLETCEWQKERSKRLKQKHNQMTQEERNEIYSHQCQEELRRKRFDAPSGQDRDDSKIWDSVCLYNRSSF